MKRTNNCMLCGESRCFELDEKGLGFCFRYNCRHRNGVVIKKYKEQKREEPSQEPRYIAPRKRKVSRDVEGQKVFDEFLESFVPSKWIEQD